MSDESALERVLARASRIPFLTLVRHLERLSADRIRVGEEGPAQREAVRFKHDPSLTFHARDVATVQHKPGGPVTITTSFAGLTGAVSPLPLFLVESIESSDDDSPIKREFLDIFHHRLLGLLARGLLSLDYPNDLTENLDDVRSRELLLLAGLLPEHAARLTGLDRAWLLRLAPLLICVPENAERLRMGIEDLLREMLAEARVSIVPFAGRYETIEDSARARLGRDLQLGYNSALGRRVLAAASRVRIRIEALTPEQCARLAPRGDLAPDFTALARLLVPEHIDVEIELTPSHAPALRLGTAILGRNSWLPSRSTPKPLRYLAEPSNP